MQVQFCILLWHCIVTTQTAHSDSGVASSIDQAASMTTAKRLMLEQDDALVTNHQALSVQALASSVYSRAPGAHVHLMCGDTWQVCLSACG